jgi:hypothetical protein
MECIEYVNALELLFYLEFIFLILVIQKILWILLKIFSHGWYWYIRIREEAFFLKWLSVQLRISNSTRIYKRIIQLFHKWWISFIDSGSDFLKAG